jgi:alpha-methylacyl-CoA racemase
MSMFYGLWQAGTWQDQRTSNVIDGGAPFYDVYRCADGNWVSIAAIEPRFYLQFLDLAGVSDLAAFAQYDRMYWPAVRARLRELFLTRTRDEWCALLASTDACFAPVLSMAEAGAHPHNVARSTFVTVDGVTCPAPAPRFSATPSHIRCCPTRVRTDVEAAIADWAGDASGTPPHPFSVT